MKKKVTLSESELIKVIGKIVESFDTENYDTEDFVEVFLQFFRPWVKLNYGDEVSEYPLSYLVKKYALDFSTDNKLNTSYILSTRSTNLKMASEIGREIVKKGMKKLPTLRPKIKFTEQYKAPLEFFINQLRLPDFFNFEFIEESPYNVLISLKVDFETLLRYPTEINLTPTSIENEIKKRIVDFLGAEIGNPTYGQLGLRFRFNYVGVEEWVKNQLNKVIKKKIKEIPEASIVSQIRFETKNVGMGGELKINFRTYRNTIQFRENVKQVLTGLGYNVKTLKVE